MPILSGELDYYTAVDNLHRMPKQRELLSCPKPYCAYVGGEGSGKTAALVTDLITNCAAEPNGLTLVGRLNMPALEGSTMRSFLEMIPDGMGEWADSKKVYTFSNRHEVRFRHLDITDPKIVGHIKSMNLSRAYVDEASEISEEIFYVIMGRCRRKSTERHTIKVASNPAGHDWMWRMFFDPDRKEKLQKVTHGITASSFDNPFLPQEYLENRLNMYPPDWADRFIYGHFSEFSDLVYKEFSEDTHVFDAAKWMPPETWPVIVGIDIGSDTAHDPWAISVIAIAPDSRLYQYGEVYGTNLLIADVAQKLQPMIAGRRIEGIAYDYANRQVGAVELPEHGIFGQSAVKEVQPGLFKCAQYFHIDPTLNHPFSASVKGSPRFFVSSHCVNAVRELGSYKWAKDRSGNATGEPSHDNSHSPDAIRYAIHTFRPLPAKVSQQKAWENPCLDMASRLYWKDADRFKDRMESYKPHRGKELTIQEWQKLATGLPKRFQRPYSARYSRV